MKKNQKNNHKKENIDYFVPIDTKCPDHPQNPINLFCVDEKELCCAYCLYKNLHDEHKVLPVNDEELLKKENISLETSKEEHENKCQKNN